MYPLTNLLNLPPPVSLLGKTHHPTSHPSFNTYMVGFFPPVSIGVMSASYAERK